MKKQSLKFLALLLSIFFLGSISLVCQEVVYQKDENGKIVFTEVVKVENVSKDILYTRGLEWFARAFKSAQDVIQMKDKEVGKIIGKGNIPISFNRTTVKWGNDGRIKLTVTLSFKDGRYKYEISDLVHEGTTAGNRDASGGSFENETPMNLRTNSLQSGGLAVDEWQLMKQMCFYSIKELIEDLKKSMVVEAKKDDW